MRVELLCFTNLIPCSREHSYCSENFILDSRKCSLEHSTKIYLYLMSCGMIFKLNFLLICNKIETVSQLHLFYNFTTFLAFKLFDYEIFGAVSEVLDKAEYNHHREGM